MKVGTYEVRGELGRGGTAVVYRGLAADGHEVAIKILKRSVGADALARFGRERRLAKMLGEAGGFVPVLESGESDQGPFLIMPFLPGGTLRERLERGPFKVPEALELARTLALTLARAHELGIVHRDLKPENVLFNRSGQPLVADLGLGKHVRADTPGASQSIALTRDGQFSGTVGYMAPEQIEGARDAGPPADVFALGAILYECLAGHPAFQAQTTFELLARATEGRFVPLATARPEVPDWLEATVARALDPDPLARFPDAASLAQALSSESAGAPRPRRLVRVLALVLLLATSVAIALAVYVVRHRTHRGTSLERIVTWEQAVVALGAGESDPARRAIARALLEDATRLRNARSEAVLHDVERALETAPGSVELRRAHARARSRLEGEAPVFTADLVALAADADLPELEALSREAIAAGTTGSQTLETARALASARPSSRALSGLLALALFRSENPAARGEATAALDSAHATAGHLRTLHEAVALVDKTLPVIANVQTVSPAEFDVASRALQLLAGKLGQDPVLAPTGAVIFAPLEDGARTAARALRVGFSGARERREGLAAFAKGVVNGHCGTTPVLQGSLELLLRDEGLNTEEIAAAHDRRLRLGQRLEVTDPPLGLALIEDAAAKIRQLSLTVDRRRDVEAAVALLDATGARAMRYVQSHARDELDSLWAASIARACVSRASYHLRNLTDASPPSFEPTGWLERALDFDRRALELVRAHPQFALDVSATAEDVIEDLLRLGREDGILEAAPSLDANSTFAAEVRRRCQHDPEGAARQLRRVLAGPSVRARPLAQPILALCEADLGHFEAARELLKAVQADQARGVEGWGPFRAEAVRLAIDDAEAKAKASAK